jgi:hypothetical protein
MHSAEREGNTEKTENTVNAGNTVNAEKTDLMFKKIASLVIN